MTWRSSLIQMGRILLVVVATAGSYSRTIRTYAHAQDQAVCSAEGSCSATTASSQDDICEDKNENCLQFARKGECQHNPGWMHENCKKSCQLCYPPQTEPCRDKHTECPKWGQKDIECHTNPGYMMSACPYSCLQCWDEEAVRQENLTQAEILQRKKYVQTDWGLWQSVLSHTDERHSQLRKLVQQMEIDMRHMEDSGPGTLCNNLDHGCMLWVTEGQCEANLRFMLESCALACRMCDQSNLFNICKRRPRPAVTSQIKTSMTQLYDHLINRHGAVDLVEEEPSSSDEAQRSPNSSGEWVLSLSKTELLLTMDGFTFENIIESVKELPWGPPSTKNYTDILETIDVLSMPDPPKINRTGTSSICKNDCLSRHPALEQLRVSIGNLVNVDTKYFQPLEFVHYKKWDRFSPHRDYSIHDSWKMSGNRLITIFIVLSKAKAGGDMGFPDLNWLVADDPELLVWPNVHPVDLQPLKNMKSEQLPIAKGEMYGVYATIRQYPYLEDDVCA